jgi:hypothetical protein
MGRGESGPELRKVQGFREWERGAFNAGKRRPSSRAGMDPQERGGAAWSSSCSWNAHDKNVLVRRAHSRIDRAAPKEVGKESGGRPLDLQCLRVAWPEKVRRKGVRRFLCSQSARPQKGLARRPQLKAPYALA